MKNYVSTGLIKLDNVISPLRGGDLFIVGARPGMGKTSFINNIALHNVVKKNNKVILFSLQHNEDTITERLICSLADLSSDIFVNGCMEEEYKKAQEAVNILKSSAGLFINDTPGLTIEALKEKSMEQQNVDFILIDYLQLLESEKNFPDRRTELDYILRKLKELAKQLNVPIMIVSTLTRECENRLDKRPILTDLRDTGSIEDIGDVVMFLYRNDYYYSNPEEANIMEVLIEKNTMGPTMIVTKFAWLNEFMKIGNLAE